MNDNQQNSGMPSMPDMESILASWSVFMGAFGLISTFILKMTIWDLPGGLLLGIIGIVLAIVSKKKRHFTQRAQLGLILSVISAVSGLMMALAIIFTMNLMESNTPMGHAVRQLMIEMTSPVATPSDALRIPKS